MTPVRDDEDEQKTDAAESQTSSSSSSGSDDENRARGLPWTPVARVFESGGSLVKRSLGTPKTPPTRRCPATPVRFLINIYFIIYMYMYLGVFIVLYIWYGKIVVAVAFSNVEGFFFLLLVSIPATHTT